MPRPSKPLFLSLAAVSLLILVPAVLLMRAGGMFRAVDYHFAGTCEAVEMPGVTRDVQVDRERGVAYLSVLDRDTGNGTVMLLDLNLPRPAPRAAMSRDPQGFRPEGIALLKQAGQPTRLVAVSRGEGDVPALEIAEQDVNGAFVPKQTLRDPAIGKPSLVVARGPSGFMVVDHREPRGGMQQKISLLLGSGDDSIVAAGGVGKSPALKELAWVSGLALSPDGSHLYVAELLKRRLGVYRIGTGDGDLTLERDVPLDTSPGNLSVDADGVIWMAAYPKPLRYFAALEGSGDAAPTQVLRFDPRQPDAKPVQVFADDGAKISAGTAAQWRGQLLIGARFDKKVLICKTVP